MKANKKLIVIIAVALVVVIAVSAVLIVSCNGKKGGDKTVYDNATTPLIFSSQEVDKVFNPFFSTTAADGNVVGMTQIGMLGNDKEGNVTYGDDEAVVTKDLEIVTNGAPGATGTTTTYYFVLKNNVRFSNGSYLTIKDVFFNLYVYLDPVYTGSSTIYSTDIVGLKEYRTQASDENEQDAFDTRFNVDATARITALAESADRVNEELLSLDHVPTEQDFINALEVHQSKGGVYSNLITDYQKAKELFKEELESDYSNSLDSYEDTKFYDNDGNEYKNLFTTDVEMFLYNEGYITWSKKDGKLSSSLTNNPAELKTWTKEQAINTVYSDMIPNSLSQVVQYWATSANLHTYLVNQAKEAFFADSSNIAYEEISGIQFANRTGSVVVNGKTYDKPEYNADGSVKSGNEVLSITINDIDPKAIWNFAFSVAPMYYYSDAAHVADFSFENKKFGVERGSQTFMNEVVKNPDKIGVPVGAGAYAASKSSGGLENVQAGDFYSLGVIYYESNPYFIMGEPKIKKIRYQVVSANQMLNSLYNNEIDFAEPNAKPETIKELDGKKADGIGSKSIRTSGYGYIGINAGKVPNVYVRQAIMHTINTQECVNYYKTTASPIYRPMSLENWAYPEGCTPYYPCIGDKIPSDLSVVSPTYAEYVINLGKNAGEMLTPAEQEAFIRYLIEDKAGYGKNADDIYASANGSDVLKYTFTIAGEETDHPAWDAMYHASEKLNKWGFSINVTTDSNALKKLSTGDLTVWAAAWGSTIDPDMYQVYHMDSTATSTLNWGYKQIKQNVGGRYNYELSLVEELSELIEAGRSKNTPAERMPIYAAALDIVMQLAVELPTYQRDDLYAYNESKIDASTLTPESELSAYFGLTSRIWNVSLNTER